MPEASGRPEPQGLTWLEIPRTEKFLLIQKKCKIQIPPLNKIKINNQGNSMEYPALLNTSLTKFRK